jgi:hypothetical protein
MKDKYLREFNEKKDFPFTFPSARNSDCFCKYCEKSFNGSQKGLFKQHLKGEKHKKNTELKKKRTATQALLEDVVEGQNTKKSKADEISAELCKALVASNIPLNKLQNPVFRGFLETHLAISIPSESLFRKKYIPGCYAEVMEKIKERLKEGSLWISADCSRDPKGREVANVIVGKLDGDKYSPPFLVNVAFLDKADAATMARLVNDTLRKLDPEFEADRARILLSDAAPYMVKCGKDLRVFFPRLLHVTCVAHALHLVCHRATELFPDVNKFIAAIKMVFLKAPTRRAAYRESCPNLPLPPEPVLTR